MDKMQRPYDGSQLKMAHGPFPSRKDISTNQLALMVTCDLSGAFVLRPDFEDLNDIAFSAPI